MRKFLASLLEVLEIAVIAVAAVFIVRTFFVQPFLVSGTSMVPTFSNGDYVLTDELTYHVRSPERGEVVVFHEKSDYSTYLIKRVIGLPGDRVVVNNNIVTIYNQQHQFPNNGLVLNESYLPKGTITSGGEYNDVTLTSSTYMMFGDNREVSYDSRSWGPLPASDIVGVVRFRLWPLNEIGIFGSEQYKSS